MSRRCSGCATSSRRGRTGSPARGATAARGCASYSVSGRVKEPGRQARAGRHHGARADRRVLRRHGGGPRFRAYLPGGASGGILPASMADIPLDFGKLEPHGCFIGSARGRDPVRPGRPQGGGAEPDAVLRGRELRPVHALPGRDREGGQADGAAAWDVPLLTELARGMTRRLDLRPRAGASNPLKCLFRYFPEEVGIAPRMGR